MAPYPDKVVCKVGVLAPYGHGFILEIFVKILPWNTFETFLLNSFLMRRTPIIGLIHCKSTYFKNISKSPQKEFNRNISKIFQGNIFKIFLKWIHARRDVMTRQAHRQKVTKLALKATYLTLPFCTVCWRCILLWQKVLMLVTD